MSSAYFYHNLQAFRDFQEVANPAKYIDTPNDWFVVVTDIKGSTKAIEKGRYKDVNTIGVSSIVAAQNAMAGLETPYVFGGDGATLLIPPKFLEAVKVQLRALQNLSLNNFQLELRVGIVPVEEIYQKGAEIKVAKYSLAGQKTLAAFSGGGITLAEKLVKGQPDRYQIGIATKSPVNISGLSCRWKPIKSSKGCVLALLVLARSEPQSNTYANVLKKLELLLEENVIALNPVQDKQLEYKNIAQCYRDEKRYVNSVFSFQFLFRFMEIVVACLIFKYHLPALLFNKYRYKKSLRSHSDYKKFDDMLRMVVECSPEAADRVENYLKGLHAEGALFYGLHRSKNSIMTCFVKKVVDGQHIHFVDGDEGGYAMAAKQLKNQLGE